MEKQQRHFLVEQLFQAALALPPDERVTFLASSCSDDEGLFNEVQSLIWADQEATSFLSSPVLQHATFTVAMDQDRETMTGRSFGHYEILELIGKGGMGEVYRGRDTRLARDVAIKFVPQEVASDESRLRRLEREARLLASLNHPNIATIHGLEYFEDGGRLLVMEMVRGETLEEVIARGPIPVEQALSIFRQIGGGLEAAHARGVIHRDLKPANVKLSSDGRVKLLDFGLAKELDLKPAIEGLGDETVASLSESGLIIGTPAYMSPEQALGQTVDHRVDIWAFGVVLYEGLSGKRAFGGTSIAEIFGKILHREPDWTRLPADPQSKLGRLIRQCLEKDAAARPEDMTQVLNAIQEARTTPGGSTVAEPAESDVDSRATNELLSPDTPVLQPRSTGFPRGTRSTGYSDPHSFRFPLLARLLTVTFAALLALAVVAASWWMWKGQTGAAVTRIESLAVLPFDNLSSDPDQEFFVDGMQDALINELSQIRALRVISRTSALRYKNSGKSLPEIARELHADVILEGSVFRDGDSVRVQVQLIRPLPEERPVLAQKYDRDMGNVLALHSDIARTIARAIKVNLTPQEETRLAASRRVTPEAYEAYLRGMYHLNKFTPEGYEKGLAYLHEALEKDPADPFSYAGLALGYSLIGHGSEPQAFRRTKALALQALEIDDTLAEAHEALAEIAFYREWDWAAAERSFQRALELKPSLAAAHAHYSWYLLVLGRKDEAIAAMKRAQEIDPLKPLYPAWLGWIHWWVGEDDKGLEEAQKSLELVSDFQWGHYVVGAVYAQKGMYREAIEAHRKAVGISPTLKWALGHTLAKAGHKNEARKIAAELKGKPTPMNAWGLTEIYAALGEKDEAFRWLDSAIDQRFSWLPGIAITLPYEPLHGDPRFEERVRRLNLPPLN